MAPHLIGISIITRFNIGMSKLSKLVIYRHSSFVLILTLEAPRKNCYMNTWGGGGGGEGGRYRRPPSWIFDFSDFVQI